MPDDDRAEYRCDGGNSEEGVSSTSVMCPVLCFRPPHLWCDAFYIGIIYALIGFF